MQNCTIFKLATWYGNAYCTRYPISRALRQGWVWPLDSDPLDTLLYQPAGLYPQIIILDQIKSQCRLRSFICIMRLLICLFRTDIILSNVLLIHLTSKSCYIWNAEISSRKASELLLQIWQLYYNIDKVVNRYTNVTRCNKTLWTIL